jgi:hypothetical protein
MADIGRAEKNFFFWLGPRLCERNAAPEKNRVHRQGARRRSRAKQKEAMLSADNDYNARWDIRWATTFFVAALFALFLWRDVREQLVPGRLTDERQRWCVGVVEYNGGSVALGKHTDAETCQGVGSVFAMASSHQNTFIVYEDHRGNLLCLTDDRGDGTDTVTLEPCREEQTNQRWTEYKNFWVSVNARLANDPQQCLSHYREYNFAIARVYDRRLVMRPCGSYNRQLQNFVFRPTSYVYTPAQNKTVVPR